MTYAQEALVRVREALSAGPTPGEWSCYDDSNDGKTSRIEIVAIGKTVARIYRSVPEQDLPKIKAAMKLSKKQKHCKEKREI